MQFDLPTVIYAILSGRCKFGSNGQTPCRNFDSWQLNVIYNMIGYYTTGKLVLHDSNHGYNTVALKAGRPLISNLARDLPFYLDMGGVDLDLIEPKDDETRDILKMYGWYENHIPMQVKYVESSTNPWHNIVCISDTHGKHNEIIIPECDILICAGDVSSETQSARSFFEWFAQQHGRYKIFVPGNHDTQIVQQLTEYKSMAARLGIHLLVNTGITIDGVLYWGTPVNPTRPMRVRQTKNKLSVFPNTSTATAWSMSRPMCLRYWKMIPKETNVLITHCPPHSIGDHVVSGLYGPQPFEAGDFGLYSTLARLTNLKLTISGHVHHGAGYYSVGEKSFINAAYYESRNIFHSKKL